MTVALEQSVVQFGRTRIPYGIRRSGRRKTVAVTVSPPGTVVLTAPEDTPLARLDAVVHAKARWIVSRLKLVQPGEAPLAAREFITGETYLYLGRQYRLAIHRGSGEAGVKLERGRLRVTVDRGLGAEHRAEAVRVALVDWYRRHAEARLLERVRWWARRLDLPEPKVLVRDQQQRWGSCSPGVVRFNWRIVQAPMRLVDYVIVHELIHLLHRSHDRAYWQALGRAMPDYERRKADLRGLGARLTWT